MHRLLELATIPAVLVALSACQSPASTPSPMAAPTPQEGAPEHHGMEPPMVLELSGPEAVSADSTITLVAQVRRSFLSPVPLHLDLSLPRGAALVEGKASETIVDTEQRLITRTWVLRVAGIPAEDLELKASWQSDTWGASAVKSYRFGRVEPRLVAPRRDGPELGLQGHRPSRGIRVTPSDGSKPKPSTP